MKTIEIIVAADGSSTVETKGFVGSDCRQASRFVETAIGQQIGERLKPEFHQPTTLSEVRQQQS
ncbi:MAG: DUF2997 domain-containing protein [Planctomycetota bacterium]|nr:DUF2997 domain-containing protein [Planctomycetota bacterium]